MSVKVESAENKLAIESSKPNRFDFLYVASGEPHKNHRNLVDGWCKLAEAGHFPSLCITVDDYIFPDLCSWIDERIAFYGLKIINLGNIPACDVKLLYRQVGALIFPSKFESLGLPLIEARQARLPIIAPEVDYVRDILDPVEAFDPGSPISIARAVRRFLGDRESPLSVLHTDEFINTIIFLAENAL
jgi:glycosyltransferase involved in cell wall biosynthesis